MARTKQDALRDPSKRYPASWYAVQRTATTLQKPESSNTSNAKKKAASETAAKPAKRGKKASAGVVGEYSLQVIKERDSGGYELSPGYEPEEEESEEYSMSVFEDEGHTWAQFELENVEGCAKFGKRTVSEGRTTFAFRWRGRSTGEGEIECDSSQKGTFTFDGDKVQGTMSTPFGRVKIMGEKISDEPNETQSYMWEDCTEEQHEVERVNRWK